MDTDQQGQTALLEPENTELLDGLREAIRDALDSIDDLAVFEAILTLIEPYRKVYRLTPEEEAELEQAEKEMDAGLGIPHEQVMRELDEWLDNNEP